MHWIRGMPAVALALNDHCRFVVSGVPPYVIEYRSAPRSMSITISTHWFSMSGTVVLGNPVRRLVSCTTFVALLNWISSDQFPPLTYGCVNVLSMMKNPIPAVPVGMKVFTFACHRPVVMLNTCTMSVSAIDVAEFGAEAAVVLSTVALLETGGPMPFQYSQPPCGTSAEPLAYVSKLSENPGPSGPDVGGSVTTRFPVGGVTGPAPPPGPYAIAAPATRLPAIPATIA